ncbi:Alpha/Beta hydrolase protein [Madurella fahalii]|uniref:Alpha/Beta hydrolase protein n=1 Tax=Madurella fahalii TaxID=1157608 RepID=A0ABQ0GHZ3_9PEZI
MADLGYASSTLLPEPSITFTVPSLHDGLPIDCRVYHPPCLVASHDAPPWLKHAAIVAHPYAPLGGCYDDHVVHLVAGTLLRRDFLVCTFNFRGAGGSAGKTSWTAKAERADYISVVGFIYHYVHFLNPLPSAASRRLETASHEDGGAESIVHIRPPTPASPEPSLAATVTPILLLGGYSYGSMITTQLPPLVAISAMFSSPECGSPAAEIRLRAQHLAEIQNAVIANARAAAADSHGPQSPRKSVGLRVGGDEENRKSHETRRPLSLELEETVRHGVAELMARAKKGHKRSRSGQGQASPTLDETHGAHEHGARPQPVSHHLSPVPGQTTFRPAYLLVSPLQGLATNLATMSFPSLAKVSKSVWNRFTSGTGEPRPLGLHGVAATVSVEAEEKLVQNSTLAIYGDRDGFVSVQRLREWASRLEAIPGSQFRAHEVSSANHFWAQHNVARTLRDAIQAFAESLLDASNSR